MTEVEEVEEENRMVSSLTFTMLPYTVQLHIFRFFSSLLEFAAQYIFFRVSEISRRLVSVS